MSVIRKQLTLFIENPIIEKIRQEFNPIQFGLIPAHITLCREDEIENLADIIKRIKALNINKPIIITLNKVERFDNGKGVFISSNDKNGNFQLLRKSILIKPRMHLPHVTLMHPRNSTCTDTIFDKICSYKIPKSVIFSKISLIAQEDGKPWTVLEDFLLHK